MLLDTLLASNEVCSSFGSARRIAIASARAASARRCSCSAVDAPAATLPTTRIAREKRPFFATLPAGRAGSCGSGSSADRREAAAFGSFLAPSGLPPMTTSLEASRTAPELRTDESELALPPPSWPRPERVDGIESRPNGLAAISCWSDLRRRPRRRGLAAARMPERSSGGGGSGSGGAWRVRAAFALDAACRSRSVRSHLSCQISAARSTRSSSCCTSPASARSRSSRFTMPSASAASSLGVACGDTSWMASAIRFGSSCDAQRGSSRLAPSGRWKCHTSCMLIESARSRTSRSSRRHGAACAGEIVSRSAYANAGCICCSFASSWRSSSRIAALTNGAAPPPPAAAAAAAIASSAGVSGAPIGERHLRIAELLRSSAIEPSCAFEPCRTMLTYKRTCCRHSPSDESWLAFEVPRSCESERSKQRDASSMIDVDIASAAFLPSCSRNVGNGSSGRSGASASTSRCGGLGAAVDLPDALFVGARAPVLPLPPPRSPSLISVSMRPSLLESIASASTLPSPVVSTGTADACRISMLPGAPTVELAAPRRLSCFSRLAIAASIWSMTFTCTPPASIAEWSIEPLRRAFFFSAASLPFDAAAVALAAAAASVFSLATTWPLGVCGTASGFLSSTSLAATLPRSILKPVGLLDGGGSSSPELLSSSIESAALLAAPAFRLATTSLLGVCGRATGFLSSTSFGATPPRLILKPIGFD